MPPFFTGTWATGLVAARPMALNAETLTFLAPRGVLSALSFAANAAAAAWPRALRG